MSGKKYCHLEQRIQAQNMAQQGLQGCMAQAALAQVCGGALVPALGRALGEGEQEGAAERPAVAQPPQAGQGVGAPLPAGQKLPMGQMACVALVEPAGQK